jgi:hypothetical protein
VANLLSLSALFLVSNDSWTASSFPKGKKIPGPAFLVWGNVFSFETAAEPENSGHNAPFR